MRSIYAVDFGGYDTVVLGGHNLKFKPHVETSDFLGLTSVESFVDCKLFKLRALVAT
jgi:hypothetical protein